MLRVSEGGSACGSLAILDLLPEKYQLPKK
jgi:hypothetical protein